MGGIYCLSSYYRNIVDLSGDATLVTSWSDGTPLAAINSFGVVGISLFPLIIMETLIEIICSCLVIPRVHIWFDKSVPKPRSLAFVGLALEELGLSRRKLKA